MAHSVGFRTAAVFGVFLSVVLSGWAAPVGAAERISGTVVAVDPKAGILMLEKMVANEVVVTLQIRAAPQARVVVSERIEKPTDFEHVFRETPITLPEIRPGDFVVVAVKEKTRAGVVADLIMVTRRGGTR